MKKKAIVVIISLLIIVGLIVIDYCSLKVDEPVQKNETPEVEHEDLMFSYDIVVSGWNSTIESYYARNGPLPLEDPEEFNTIKINKNNVTIQQIFVKPTPCSHMNYTLAREDNTIGIIQRIIPETSLEGGCVQVLAYEEVEISLTVEYGDYIINFYGYWDLDKPFLSENITIE